MSLYYQVDNEFVNYFYNGSFVLAGWGHIALIVHNDNVTAITWLVTANISADTVCIFLKDFPVVACFCWRVFNVQLINVDVALGNNAKCEF